MIKRFRRDNYVPISRNYRVTAGVWLELYEDFRGLRVRGKLIPDVVRGGTVLPAAAVSRQ